ncbi:MAG: hypothetical protein HC918_09385, partial [Oscillatoriales cyanobacterium SM2_1_8]|nr:hypothetical protein [Oscillatoriales cyanobacterium SM2_1_8]
MSSEFAKSQPNAQPEATAEAIDWMMLGGAAPVPAPPPPKGTAPAPAKPGAKAEPSAPPESSPDEDISWFLLSEVPKPTEGKPTLMQPSAVPPAVPPPAPDALADALDLPDVDLATFENFELDFASTPQDFGLDLSGAIATEALLDLPDIEPFALPSGGTDWQAAVAAPESSEVEDWEAAVAAPEPRS